MSAAWVSALRRSVPSAPRWLRGVIPARRGTTAPVIGISEGSNMVSRTQPIHTDAAANGNAKPANKASMPAGADSVRRRLSSIFQRPIAGMPWRVRSAPAVGPRPNIHGSNCQSPRAQR